MNIQLPLVFVLGLIVFAIVKVLRLRLWVVAVIVLFGFYLAHTMLAPTIDATTKAGVGTVNNRH
jgi:hypothetical protein